MKTSKKFFVELIFMILLVLNTNIVFAQKVTNYENTEGVIWVKISQKKNTRIDTLTVKATLFKVQNDQILIYNTDMMRGEWYKIEDIEEIIWVVKSQKSKSAIIATTIIGGFVGVLMRKALTKEKTMSFSIIEIKYKKYPVWPLVAGPFAGLALGLLTQDNTKSTKLIYSKEKGFLE